jgi:hypothetical protein
MCVSIFSARACNISHSKRKCERYDNVYIGLHVKYPSFLSVFNETWILLDKFFKNPQISNFMEIRPLGAELFHADRQTDEQIWRR